MEKNETFKYVNSLFNFFCIVILYSCQSSSCIYILCNHKKAVSILTTIVEADRFDC